MPRYPMGRAAAIRLAAAPMAVAQNPQATMAGRRHRHNALSGWYGGLRHGSAAAWAAVTTGFATRYHDLTGTLRPVREEAAQEENAAPEPPSGDGKR